MAATMTRKEKKQKKAQMQKLEHVLRDWSCMTIKEAKTKAANEPELRLALVECGVQL